MKALVHLAGRAGAETALREAVAAEARTLDADAPGDAEVGWMWRLGDDPFGKATRFHATLELRATEGASPPDFAASLDGLADRLGDLVHADLSSALVGTDRVFVAPAAPAPVRYQYLMRRNASFTHDEYLARYAEIHSRFGVETPGIEGYVQFHVDPDASRAAAARAGFGIWAVDSVSELHLVSVETFLAEVAKSPVGVAALEDEEVFVDRPRSFDFCSEVFEVR